MNRVSVGQASKLIGTCIESSRRHDRHAELLLAVSRFAAVLKEEAIVRAMVMAASEWLKNRVRFFRIWVLYNPSLNRLALYSSHEQGCEHTEPTVPGIASPQRGKVQNPPNKYVLKCYAKREKVHVHVEEEDSSVAVEGVSHTMHGDGTTKAVCESLCVPISFPSKDAMNAPTGDVAERVWGVFEMEAMPGECFTALDVSLMLTVASHAGLCISHAEAKAESDTALSATTRLFHLAAALFACKSTQALFQTTCAAASQIVDAQHISLFAMDNEGRQGR